MAPWRAKIGMAPSWPARWVSPADRDAERSEPADQKWRHNQDIGEDARHPKAGPGFLARAFLPSPGKSQHGQCAANGDEDHRRGADEKPVEERFAGMQGEQPAQQAPDAQDVDQAVVV